MSLGASRFTAFLAVLAMAGMAFTFWWAIQTRLEMKAAASSRPDRPAPQKFTGRVGQRPDARASDTRASDTRTPDTRTSDTRAGGGFELAGHTSAMPADTGAAPGSTSASIRTRFPDLPQTAALQGQANMPLPMLLPPQQAQPEPAPVAVPTKFVEPPAYAAAAPPPPPPPPAPAPARDSGRRHARAAVTPPPVAAAPATPKRFYVEKYFDLGEYHYRRRTCEPPNMPDVCFMPPTGHDPIIVVARP